MQGQGRSIRARELVSDENLPVPLGRLIAKATFFVSKWLDPDQVRVSEVSPTEFRVKCGKMLTDQEVKGAIVKYLLSKQQRIQPMSARDPYPFDQMHEETQEEYDQRDRDDYVFAEVDDLEDFNDPDEDDDLDLDEDGEDDDIFGLGDGENEGMEEEEDLDQEYVEDDFEEEPTPEDIKDAEDLEGLED